MFNYGLIVFSNERSQRPVSQRGGGLAGRGPTFDVLQEMRNIITFHK